MTKHHYEKIQVKGDLDRNLYESHITYTRPFDFMDAYDRKEVLEPLSWFGYIQSGAYDIYT